MKYLFKNYILDDFKINPVLVLVTKCYILCYMETNQILMAYSMWFSSEDIAKFV